MTHKYINWLKKRLITGIILILPLAVSLWIVITLFKKIDNIFKPIIVKIIGYHIPALGVLITFLIIWLTGIFGSKVIGKKIFNKLDNFMLKIPLFKAIYGTTKQAIDAFKFKEKTPFKQVVMFEYPRENAFALGFVTNILNNEIQNATIQKLVCVFYITTPNPTSGVLLLIPEEDLTPLTMSTEDALKLIISGGLFTPPYFPKAKPIELNNKNLNLSLDAQP
jgi:uncharacterized membrane protein